MVLALMLALLRGQISPEAAVRSAAELSLRLLGVPEPECLQLAAKAIEQVGAVTRPDQSSNRSASPARTSAGSRTTA
jgi:hypothetical protein